MGVFREEIQGLAALGINREEGKEREGEERIQLMNTSYTYMFDLLHSLLVPRPRLKVGRRKKCIASSFVPHSSARKYARGPKGVTHKKAGSSYGRPIVIVLKD